MSLRGSDFDISVRPLTPFEATSPTPPWNSIACSTERAHGL